MQLHFCQRHSESGDCVVTVQLWDDLAVKSTSTLDSAICAVSPTVWTMRYIESSLQVVSVHFLVHSLGNVVKDVIVRTFRYG